MSYYPQGVSPIHHVVSWAKVRSIVRAVEAGERVPSILMTGTVDRPGTLFTGTHRWVANELLERRGVTTRRVGVVSVRSLPGEIRELLVDLWLRVDMWLVQEVFHSYLREIGEEFVEVPEMAFR